MAWGRTIGAAALSLGLASLPAEAGVRPIGAADLQVVYRESEVFERSSWRATSDDTTPAVFWAPVNLPVGARIRRFTFFSWGSASSTRFARLYRVRTGGVPLLLMALTTNEDRSVWESPVTIAATPSLAPPAAYLVRRGYRYYVELTAVGSNASIQGAKVTYR